MMTELLPVRPARGRRTWIDHAEARPVTVTLVAALLLHLLWLTLLANSGGDIAAQDAWAEFAKAHPDSAYNLAWYGGMHAVSYSVISPYVMALIGVRLTMIVSGTFGAALLAVLLVRSRRVPHPLVPSLIGAVSMVGNAVSGRVTFGLGMLFGLAALAVVFAWPENWRFRHRVMRGVLVALLSALACGSSPVAGLFLGIVAGGLWMGHRHAAAYALGIPPVVVIGLSSWLFPFGGKMPIAWDAILLPVGMGLVMWFCAPKSWRHVRYGSLLYVAFSLFAWLVPSPIGTNVTRLGLIFGGVLIVAVWLTGEARSPWARVPVGAILGVAMFFSVGWQVGTAARDEIATAPSAAWHHSSHAIVAQLQRRDSGMGRVEVVPTASHRESAALAPVVNLARGWNRQADVKLNPMFYGDGTLDATTYRAWLDRWAVRYVVVPPGSPDIGGGRERTLVEGGLPYLTEVWHNHDWVLYRVSHPQPLVSGPAQLVKFDAAELVLNLASPATVTVRIPWSPWLTLVDDRGHTIKVDDRATTAPDGCLDQVAEPEAPQDGWVQLQAPRPGLYRIASPYHLGDGSRCPSLGTNN